MKPNISLRLTLNRVVYFCVWLGQGCERVKRSGLCQCRAAVCLLLSSLPTIVRMGGWHHKAQ